MTESPVWVGGLKERLELSHREDRGGSCISTAVRLRPNTALRTRHHAEKDEPRLWPVLHLPGQVRLSDSLRTPEEPWAVFAFLLTLGICLISGWRPSMLWSETRRMQRTRWRVTRLVYVMLAKCQLKRRRWRSIGNFWRYIPFLEKWKFHS